ncbi:hypothetical protein LCGC14_2833270 [marine sediment metagenome]|uniref:Uncharacterized protein n=1 Tax=marine sediment metagenome TaxID=412755 RepID=A0A0F8Z057_9ZZZZ
MSDKPKDVGQPLEQPKCEHNWLDRGFIAEKCSKCGAIKGLQDTINKTKPPEILEIECLISQVNKKLLIMNMTIPMSDKPESKLISQALEEIDLFQKTTLHDLRKEFE